MELILSPTNLAEEFSLVLFNERRISAEEDVDDHTERPHIRLGIISDAFKNFWSDISRSSTLSVKRVGMKTLLRKSKVSNFNFGVVILRQEEKILRLEIAVSDGSFMTISDTLEKDFAYITSFLFVVVRFGDDAAVNRLEKEGFRKGKNKKWKRLMSGYQQRHSHISSLARHDNTASHVLHDETTLPIKLPTLSPPLFSNAADLIITRFSQQILCERQTTYSPIKQFPTLHLLRNQVPITTLFKNIIQSNNMFMIQILQHLNFIL